MKGPGFRIDLDVRRVWICQRCSRVRKLPGSVTSAVCPFCGPEAGMMKLEEMKRVDRPFRPPVYHEIEVEDEDLETPESVSEEQSAGLAGDAPIATADTLDAANPNAAPDLAPPPSQEETADFLQELQRLEEQSRTPRP